MDTTISLSLLISLGGTVASIATAFAVVKTKVGNLEEEFEKLRKTVESQQEEMASYREDEKIRIALIERNQETHNKEFEEIKTTLKTAADDIQTIKEALIKKGVI